jgi:hypothetical protein
MPCIRLAYACLIGISASNRCHQLERASVRKQICRVHRAPKVRSAKVAFDPDNPPKRQLQIASSVAAAYPAGSVDRLRRRIDQALAPAYSQHLGHSTPRRMARRPRSNDNVFRYRAS